MSSWFDEEVIRPAVRLSTDGDDVPLWLIAGAGVSVFHLLPLAQALKGRAPIYGFGSGLGSTGRVVTSVEAMTEPMLRSLRTIQPQGPYLLAGNSFGGWLALDLANRLIADGASVAFLGMLDAAGPGYPALLPHASFRSRQSHWERTIFRNYRAGLTSGRWRRRFAALRRRGASVARAVRGGTLNDLDLRLKLRAQEEACIIAKMRYAPQPFDGQMTTFHAQPRRPDTYQIDPELGWTKYSRLIKSVAVPGTHSTFMYEPQVSFLAASMAEAIDAALSAY